MNEIPYARAFRLVWMLLLITWLNGPSAVGQEEIPLPGASATELSQVYVQRLPCDCVAQQAGCEVPACGACLKKHHQQWKHLHYLKSIRGGTAQYTHRWNRYHAQQTPWQGRYYHTDWGSPIALVVPPTAAFQTRWGWGVGQTTAVPIYHQFARPDPGPYEPGGPPFQSTPWWPSHTDQFGVYYVRGPW